MRLSILATIGILAFSATNCLAISLNEARSKGLVCEKSDGLLKNTSGSIEADDLITQVNAQRLQEYRRVAQQNGASLGETQRIFGQKLQAQHGGC